MSERGGYRCCFKDCPSTTNAKRGKKETLFRFPKDTERLVYIILFVVQLSAFNTNCNMFKC